MPALHSRVGRAAAVSAGVGASASESNCSCGPTCLPTASQRVLLREREALLLLLLPAALTVEVVGVGQALDELQLQHKPGVLTNLGLVPVTAATQLTVAAAI